MAKFVHVAVAVIEDGRGRVLVSKRPDHVHQGGFWEFPGGKVESDESVFDALVRECQEELAITVAAAKPLISIPHHYCDKSVLLDVWSVNAFTGTPEGVEGQAVEWRDRSKLKAVDFPAANKAIISALNLPDTYFITPEFKTLYASLEQLDRVLATGVKMVQWRSPNLPEDSYLSVAPEVIACCHRYGAKVLLKTDMQSAMQLGADGIHLTSSQLLVMNDEAVLLPEGQRGIMAASCHSLVELEQAQKINADFVTLSPVNIPFSHATETQLGWSEFERLVKLAAVPVYALGGMSVGDLPQAISCGAQGIAGIKRITSQG